MTNDTLITASGTATDTRTVGRSRFSLHFSARDLISVAIFAVIYVVIVYTIAMLGIVSPVVMVLTLPLSIIVAGIPYMLFLTRVKHAGLVTLFGIVAGILTLIGGHPWISTVLTVAVSLVAEVILFVGRYRSRWTAILAYAVFSLWFIGPMLPLLLNRGDYLNSQAMQQMGPEYMASFEQVFSVTAVWIYNAATLICGVVGGLLGSAILRKHFVRAGLA